MLPKRKRLTRASFGAISQGNRLTSTYFSISVARSLDGRAAAVVSKKVAQKAVDRHLLKRRILAVAAPEVRPGRSFVVYARAGSAALPYPQLRKELEALLARLPS